MSSLVVADISKKAKEGGNPGRAQVRKWLAKVEKLLAILTLYADEGSVKELEARRQTLGDVLAGIGLTAEGRDKQSEIPFLALLIYFDDESDTGLPKAIRDALEFLASEKQVADVAALIEATLQPQHDVDEQAPSLEFGESVGIEWSEGVEKYAKVPLSQLWMSLGIKDNYLPMFNHIQDPDGVRDPWDEEQHAWFKEPKNTVSLRPRWHQVVGIVSIVERFFAGDPVLLMDEVGLGKTLQMVGAITVLTYFRQYYAANTQFPGMFGMLRF